MNSQEVFLSLTGNTSSNIAYLMCDQLFDAIEFGDLVTTGSLSSDYIVVASTFISAFIIDNNGPISITFNPSQLTTPNKISRIVYQFDDGTPTITNSFYYSPTSISTMNYPFSSEPGDPRNFPVTKEFYSSKFFTQTFSVIVNIYQFGVVDPLEVLYTININAPQMDGLNGGYFEEMHLISARMFGLNNDILYTFETINPNYLIPVHLNWNQSAETTIGNVNIKPLTQTPYRILQPYELDNLTKNSNIKFVQEKDATYVASDLGLTTSFRMLNNESVSSLYPYISGHLITKDGKYLRLGSFYNSTLNK
jgi:hypothetical protein